MLPLPWPDLGLRGLGAQREKAKLDHFPGASPPFISMNHLTTWLPSKVLTFIGGVRAIWRGRGHHIKGRFQIKRFECEGSSGVPQLALTRGTRRLEESGFPLAFGCIILRMMMETFVLGNHFYLVFPKLDGGLA